MKSRFFSGLIMAALVLAAYVPMRGLPDFPARPPATAALSYRPVALASVGGPLQLAGAWEAEADDPRLRGLSALTLDHGRLLAISDLGTVVRFDPPTAARPLATLSDFPDGPGEPGRKDSRDAESLVRDPRGRGWWVGFEQRHSLWLYDSQFTRILAAVDLDRSDWRDNRGAEGLISNSDGLLALAENGREAVEVGARSIAGLRLETGTGVADAARAPDGSAWLLLRSKGWDGISQSIAPLIREGTGYRIGPAWPLPKAAFDNYEGMAIAPLANGGWRFWLVTDDGHRLMARTLLVALDLPNPPGPGHDKSPAKTAGLSKKPTVETP